MRIVLSEFISLDGVVQAPGGTDEDPDGGFAHGGWSEPYFDIKVMGPVLDEAMEETDALLFGRRTWQIMAASWPEMPDDPFTDRMNAFRKYVVSRTLTQDELHWDNSHLLDPDDPIGAVAKLRAAPGGALQVPGSSQLARTLITEDLVDEYLLMVEPIVLGGGKRLFPEDGVARPLKLVSTTTTSTDVTVCRYRPA